MTNEDKDKVKQAITNSVEVFRRRTNTQYSLRCPFCGDSQKDVKDSHCYIKFSYDESEPLLYKCFLCNRSGVINDYFLKKIGVKEDLSRIVEGQRRNKILSIKNTNVDIISGEVIPDSNQIKYIESRLGTGLTLQDYDNFKILWNIENLIPFIESQKIKNSLPSNYDSVSFLSDDKSLLLTRFFGDGEIRWKKIRIMKGNEKTFYTIKAMINLFTQEDIVVNIAEGIMDVISIYKNFNDGPNSIFIAALGSDYISALDYMIAKGFIGNNVIIKIYMDADQSNSKLARQLKRYKWIFKSIHILVNIKSKDVGVKLEEIKLKERRI